MENKKCNSCSNDCTVCFSKWDSEWDSNCSSTRAAEDSFTFKYSGAYTINGKVVYIKKVIYNNPATIIIWSDGTKTVTKCDPDDFYTEETGLMICLLKKLVGSTELFRLYDDWLPVQGNTVTIKNVRNKYKEINNEFSV